MGMANSFINFTSLWIEVTFLRLFLLCPSIIAFIIIKRNKINVFPDSFIVTGLVESAAIPYLGIRIEELSLDQKAEILFLDQGYALILDQMWFFQIQTCS